MIEPPLEYSLVAIDLPGRTVVEQFKPIRLREFWAGRALGFDRVPTVNESGGMIDTSKW